MWFKLASADFSNNNLGKMSILSTTWPITKRLSGFTETTNTGTSVEKGAAYNATFTLNSGETYKSHSVTMNGSAVISGVSYSGGTLTVNISTVTGPVVITTVVEGSSSGNGESTDPTPPAAGETVTFTLDTATTASTTEMVHTSQSIGSAVAYQEAGTRGVVTWDIPAYAVVTLTVATGGSYGMVLTDRNNIVIASIPTANATNGTTIVFPIQTIPTRVHASKAKFTSGSYTTYSEEEMKGMELSVSFTGAVAGKYISTSQTVGSSVAFSNLSSGSYNISNTIPANTRVTITCKETTAGGYGMALCDTSGKVIEYISHRDTESTDNKHTFPAQTVETKLYVSVNKFVSATYQFV